MVAEHGEGPRQRGCGELGFAGGRGIDVLTVNDPWAKEVENTGGQDGNVTTNETDKGQESTEKVEKTVELLEGLLGFHQKMDQVVRGIVRAAHGEAHLVLRGQAAATGSRLGRAPLGKHTVAGGGPLQEAHRWSCRPLEAQGSGFVKVDGADVFTFR